MTHIATKIHADADTKDAVSHLEPQGFELRNSFQMILEIISSEAGEKK